MGRLGAIAVAQAAAGREAAERFRAAVWRGIPRRRQRDVGASRRPRTMDEERIRERCGECFLVRGRRMGRRYRRVQRVQSGLPAAPARASRGGPYALVRRRYTRPGRDGCDPRFRLGRARAPLERLWRAARSVTAPSRGVRSGPAGADAVCPSQWGGRVRCGVVCPY